MKARPPLKTAKKKKKRVKRRVMFLVPVDFVAYSEECIDYLAKQYEHDPSHEAWGCHADHGTYHIKRRKLRRAP